MKNKPNELQADQVRHTCNPAVFNFVTTTDLPVLTESETMGQERARRAASFGIEMGSQGYYIFALGPTLPGRNY